MVDASEQPSFHVKLSRIQELACTAATDDLIRNLLHAYVACFTTSELCRAAVSVLNAELPVRRAVTSRLVRIGRENGEQSEVDALGQRLLHFLSDNPAVRRRVDALLSQIYPYMHAPTRNSVLERWKGRGTSGAAARWLKAAQGDQQLFDIEDVLSYWRYSRDSRAAKLLAYRSAPSLLEELLPELIERCSEGWIVSRAAVNARVISEDCWLAIRGKFPATFAYLCAKLGRSLSHSDALAIVEETGAMRQLPPRNAPMS